MIVMYITFGVGIDRYDDGASPLLNYWIEGIFHAHQRNYRQRSA